MIYIQTPNQAIKYSYRMISVNRVMPPCDAIDSFLNFTKYPPNREFSYSFGHFAMCHLIRKSGSRFSKPWMFDTINNLILCLLWISRGALMGFQGLVEWYPFHKSDGVLREVWVVGQIDGRWIIGCSLINFSGMAASIILSVDTFICLVLHREKNYLWY